MKSDWANFDNESRVVIKELAEENITFGRLVKKLNTAKNKVNSAKLNQALDKIKK